MHADVCMTYTLKINIVTEAQVTRIRIRYFTHQVNKLYSNGDAHAILCVLNNARCLKITAMIY